MTKQKIAVIVGVPVVAILLLVGGFFLGKHGYDKKKLSSLDDATSSYAASNNSVPLGQDEPSGTTNNLSVNTPQAMDLGQLGAGAGASGGAQGNSASSSAGSGGGSNSLNPATFKDYEKYKDQQHALFGEINKGTGDELVMNKRAAVYYRGWLTHGQVFDQSRTNTSGQKQPLIFTLGAHEVVPGMEEGVLGMKVGGKRLIIIPPAVGYGAQGQGPVPPNSLMVFEVELVTVQ